MNHDIDYWVVIIHQVIVFYGLTLREYQSSNEAFSSFDPWVMWNQGLVNLDFDDNKTKFRTNDYISKCD